MNSKTRKLTKLLGLYIDLEAELVSLLENKLNHEGLWFKIPLHKFSLTEGTPLDLPEYFFILHPQQKLRNNLSKPYLAVDETYEMSFCINQRKKLSQVISAQWDLRLTPTIEVSINQENLRFWKEAFKQKYLLLEVKRIESGQLIPQTIKNEMLSEDSQAYANLLKNKIPPLLSNLRNPQLLAQRLQLWGYSNLSLSEKNAIIQQLPPLDFGVKDVISLRKVWQDFSFNISNEQLLHDTDPEVEIYRKKINNLLEILSRGGIIDLPAKPFKRHGK